MPYLVDHAGGSADHAAGEPSWNIWPCPPRRRSGERAGREGGGFGYRDAMSTVEILGWFVLLPIAFYAVVSLLVYTPSWVRGPKYRPGLSWWAEPVWIGGG